ncbi:MAG: hypothetical protein ABSH56_16080 [Bryobacteraceae bacterium]
MRYPLPGGLSVVCVAAAICASAAGNDPGRPITDEALRIAALRTIFAGMQVSVDRGKKIDDSWPKKPKAGGPFFPDALAGEADYRVTGKAMNEVETGASEDIDSGKFSDTRQVRFKLFRWPKEESAGLLAVLQYKFSGANPGGCCRSIGLLVHLVRNAAGWSVRQEYLLETQHHTSLEKVELLDLTGGGADELVIESDVGGGGGGGIVFHVFDLRHGRFEKLLQAYSDLEYMDQEGYTQVLDVDRTVQSHGQQFCFSKTTRFEKGKWFKAPRVTHPCYERGYGVDAKETSGRRLGPPGTR